MSSARVGHTAWTPPSNPDSIFLLGGDSDATELTAEILPGGDSFALSHSGNAACGIPDNETIVMTGGYNSDNESAHSFVTRYNISGFVEELPQLQESRYRHSCASLPS